MGKISWQLFAEMEPRIGKVIPLVRPGAPARDVARVFEIY